MFRHLSVITVGLFFSILTGCASISLLDTVASEKTAEKQGCYLLKVNFWAAEGMPSEIQEAIKKEKFPGLSSKYGGFLRSRADTQPSYFSCKDLRDKKSDDGATLNTGSPTRVPKPYLVSVTDRSGNSLTANSEQGIARFYFTETSRLKIKVLDFEGSVVSPKLGYIMFDASEWRKDPTGNDQDGYVMSVHFFMKQ